VVKNNAAYIRKEKRDWVFVYFPNTGPFISPAESMTMASKKDLTIQSVFPGKWNNAYSHEGGPSGAEDFEIVDGTKCFVEGKHKFNITGFRYDAATGTITFAKEWVGVSRPPIINTIRKIDARQYEGTENDGARVVYKRIG
jgi:hypothetical protein